MHTWLRFILHKKNTDEEEAFHVYSVIYVY